MSQTCKYGHVERIIVYTHPVLLCKTRLSTPCFPSGIIEAGGTRCTQTVPYLNLNRMTNLKTFAYLNLSHMDCTIKCSVKLMFQSIHDQIIQPIHHQINWKKCVTKHIFIPYLGRHRLLSFHHLLHHVLLLTLYRQQCWSSLCRPMGS
jgi:hypothetical protein